MHFFSLIQRWTLLGRLNYYPLMMAYFFHLYSQQLSSTILVNLRGLSNRIDFYWSKVKVDFFDLLGQTFMALNLSNSVYSDFYFQLLDLLWLFNFLVVTLRHRQRRSSSVIFYWFLFYSKLHRLILKLLKDCLIHRFLEIF